MLSYVKNTSNCQGLPLGWDSNITILEELGEFKSILVKTGEDLALRTVVGWSDLFFGSPVSLNVYRCKAEGKVGILVTGGNSGLRILANDDDEEIRTTGVDDHLPNGWGMPIMWIEDENDIVEYHSVGADRG